MGRVSKKKFPTELIIAENLRQDRSKSTSMQEEWVLQLDEEKQSLLLHSDAMIKILSPRVVLYDLPRARNTVQWDAILERLRDIHSLDRLFQGFSSLQKRYTLEVDTIAPIGLLAVSLNNHAVTSGSPCKLSQWCSDNIDH
jgi:hypothetical protein